MTDPAFLVQLDGYGLTTAEICYFMPDHPSLLQIYAWQEYDAAPDFPVLFEFLAYWGREIEAEIRSVRIAHDKLLGPATWRPVDGVISWDE
ncbi:usg protein [Erythrobacter sp. THAF29]|uniref:usg protein n=1 Tax=Erythrobacter sp. THAF29 TaxID=2587851 RepID=UPI0012685E30|nr:usg protein [Erythrobacter sp. THAF29]QFT76821.1 Usg-like family protein [Erythrobacter sp. THAF29]